LRYQRASRLFQIQEEVSRFWESRGIVEKALRPRGRPKFFFLDGPPYVTERIHVGTAWNKVLKDAILRYKRMRGYDVWSIPGYDTHGLPIEVAVEKRLGIESKKEITERVGIGEFNRLCMETATRNMQVITEQFKSLAVWMDWDRPYVTYKDEYISGVWWIIKKIYERGLLTEDVRVFWWCPRCETVLSEHEVAMGYEEMEAPSIYVKFPLADDPKTSLLIWTTTPWTLPSNVAVAAHPDYMYALVELRNGERLIVMEARLDKVIKEEYRVLSVFHGRELAYKRYINPLARYVDALREVDAHYVILSSEYVSPEEGTGLVHMAPEHGREDFELGRQYNLPIVTIVDASGRFTEKAGKYRGMHIFEADEVIMKDLEELGCLYRRERIVHRYPVCWRCKTPLFMRTTRQWIIRLSELRDQLLSESSRVSWVPRWAGEQRFRSWLETARDWVITRQRYWGTPAPIWKCESCGYVEVIGGIDELRKRGFDVKELHRPYIDEVEWSCPKCGGRMRRIPDVLDVWIDSGAAPWASINYPRDEETYRRLWPVDFVTEGHDQTRGWFYAMLGLGVAAFGEVPYRTVLVHGFTLDEQGRGMHKSLGNVIYPEEFTERYGVDAFRVMVLSHPIWEDMIVSFRKAEEAVRDLNIVLNVCDFYKMYASIDRYRWPGRLERGKLLREDLWIISRLESVLDAATRYMEGYQIHMALREILRFAVEELSRRYVRAVRRRVWIEEDAPEKLAVYHTLHYVLKRLAAALAPFAPYTAEYIYREVVGAFEDLEEESVHLSSWPEPARDMIDPELEREFDLLWQVVAAANSIRQAGGVKIRQPLRELVIPESVYRELSARGLELLREQVNVAEVRAYGEGEEERYTAYRVTPLMDRLGPRFRAMAPRVAEALSRLGREEAMRLARGEAIKLRVNGEEVEVGPDCVTVERAAAEGYGMAEIAGKPIFLSLSIDEELFYEGLADVLEEIDVYLSTEDGDIMRCVEEKRGYIASETRARRMLLESPPGDAHTREWDIDGHKVAIGIVRLPKKQIHT